MKIRLVFTFTFVLSGLLVFSQHALPPKGELFRDNVVPSIYVTLPADSLAEILDYDNRLSDYHYHASFVFDNGVVRDSIAVVGFRLRGNTSRKSQKKSFKISFNEYVSGQKYQGLEKLNINGEHNDPSLSRAKYCFNFLDYLEVPASRTNHVRLYINGDYFGLYLNVEHYDEEFTKSRFNGNGNLYKCTYGADLQYRGAAGNSYKLDYYEIKNPDGPNAYEDLARFITVLNNTPSSDFECEIEQIFNVNSYLKCLVMDVLSGNWDGPNYNKNNFYLYFNTHSAQFEYIPYDLDNTLGVDFLGVEWSGRNIYNWSKSNSNRPLFTKIMARETYRNRFNYFLDKALSEYFNPTLANDRFNDIRLLISDAAKADTIRTLDYGYTWSDFNSSFGYFSKDHVKYGIQDFVTRRYNSAVSQLQTLETTGGIPLWHAAVLNAVGDSITYTIRVEEEESLESLVVNYNWEYQSAMWADTLDLMDSVNHWYSKTIAWHPTLKQVAYSFTLKGSTISTEYPVCDMFSLVKPSNDIKLYINELMADNSTTKMD
ncbi:MAG: spore coat protein H, partial [Bacteroidia bacterium]